MCGQLQCQGGWARPLRGSTRDLHWEILEANGTQPELNCSWVHLDLGNDVAQPLLTLPGTACGPDLVSSPKGARPGGEGCLDHGEQCPGLAVHRVKGTDSEGGVQILSLARAKSCPPVGLGFSIRHSAALASQGQ